MKLRVLENRWQLMLAVNVAVLFGDFLYKVTLKPYVPYLHLLVDYHFGFTKRALIGALVSTFVDKVPLWLVYALGGIIWLVTAALFVRLFRRTFGVGAGSEPLFVFMAGSPFFLKNFMFTLGHFDIYGCAVALGLLLVPAHSIAFVIAAAVASMVLILIHHIHFLMYVPTIVTIVLLRHYLAGGVNRGNLIVGFASAAALGLLFLGAQFYGTMQVPSAAFVEHIQHRIADASQRDLFEYAHAFASIWYQPLSTEIHDTWERMPNNLMGVPVYALLVWLHTPLWRYFRDLIRSVAIDWHRRIIVAAIMLVSAAYLVMFAIVFDYSRWISNWAVCMFLILLAVRTVPATKDVPLIPAEDRKTNVFGWILTLIPRVGIIRPF
ncbi:MAG: hypothetical protein HY852_07340 [Bradyrhizobium sp.]|uniref:hypothetical protein n=1 Tax=Bradyrhizobium sp. TaxID=376 RepID=UPI0025BD9155|nr:hypothetical protein [Bradyrhizobium sp.]MBI5261616.1 hypothetical protein [Bradyrhizobium sp.]